MDRFAPSDVPEPHYIAMYGGTGVGKSTFVNDASGTDVMPVGHDLPSCTQQVMASETFKVDGQDVVLFDTPGFDDTTISDADTLKRIAEFLESMYRRGIKLKGIVYLHRITDMRMTGASARTFRLLRSLCGAKNLSNVIIVTNMWSDPPTEDELLRERQLQSDFFKSALDDGALIMRREHPGQQSAHGILRALLPKPAVDLLIQEELYKGVPLPETEAGRMVRAEIEAKLSKQDQELKDLREEIKALVMDSNTKAERELEQYRERKEREMSLLRAQLASLTMEIEEGRRFWEGQFEDMRTRRVQAMRLAEEQGE
ncbi:P-loop containing nucleoside triphosphate hydrolase protein [Rhizoctonia solani]|nr:P-loop containing nucleoside triphosphate hydrolase protein [Rhizoctonia solani]